MSGGGCFFLCFLNKTCVFVGVLSCFLFDCFCLGYKEVAVFIFGVCLPCVACLAIFSGIIVIFLGFLSIFKLKLGDFLDVFCRVLVCCGDS